MTAPATYRWDTHANPWHPGLGDVATQYGSQALGAGASILAAFGVATALTGPLAPFVAAAGALVALFGQIFSGCGQTCVLASQDANQVETILKNNLTSYLAGGHTASEQQAALAVFQYAAQQLTNACGNPSLGKAGQNCISQRLVPTACQWKTSPGGWSNGVYIYPGPAGSGSTCWNWIVGYYDPIANDPTVVPDPGTSPITTGGTTATGATATTSTSSTSPLLLIGLAALIGIALL